MNLHTTADTLTSSDEGLYRCVLPAPDPAARTELQTYYIGIYRDNHGKMCIHDGSLMNFLQITHHTSIVHLFINVLGVPDITALQFELISDLKDDPPVFTLTCTSTGGPANNVTWTRDGSTVTNHVFSQTVINTTTAEYNNTLTVTGREPGNYQCTVSNARGSATRSIVIHGNVRSIIISFAYNLLLKQEPVHPLTLVLDY